MTLMSIFLCFNIVKGESLKLVLVFIMQKKKKQGTLEGDLKRRCKLQIGENKLEERLNRYALRVKEGVG